MSNFKTDRVTSYTEAKGGVQERQDRLLVLKSDSKEHHTDLIVEALKKDQVILVKDVNQHEADELMFSTADRFGLSKSLELQAAFASSLGHRKNIGKYYMTVNKREDYQFVTPHSEGESFTGLQLASFFCEENTTDGGETILMNVNPFCNLWGELREKVRRGRSSRPLTEAEVREAKILLRLNMPGDTLKEEDEILTQTDVNEFFSLFEVLIKPTSTHCKILDQQCFTYWDSVESIDFDSAKEFGLFLKNQGLLKLPPNHHDYSVYDESKHRRIKPFGSHYNELFRAKITRKLLPGDFLIQNNLTWCHAVNNWTPGSGVRRVVAAFA